MSAERRWDQDRLASARQAQQTVESDWIATIAFTYTRAPRSEPDRLRNPLGFQVTSYRADPEVIR